MNSSSEANKLLKKLSVAIVEHPRGTTKELAEAVGISKATLHRTYGTRDHLETILMEKAAEAVTNIIMITEIDFEDYKEGLKILLKAHYENKEFLTFVCGYQLGVEDVYWNDYFKALDSFFLKGQKQGVFKIDFSVPALTEIFVASFSGMIDAERRGRVGSSYLMENLENFLFHGLLTQ